MTLESFFQNLKDNPDIIEFNDTMNIIDSLYIFTPTSFKNGDLVNEPGQNSGSCKIFSFAHLHSLTPQQTLTCFGGYYRDDVLKHPENEDHQNIRNFMKSGWDGIEFDSEPLKAKAVS
ncbi:MAG: HopJ type III effector protein [Candidatus Brocadiales bacterium]|nr:HopJ type III effector protein [Candidatus Brocadiales bacterium]